MAACLIVLPSLASTAAGQSLFDSWTTENGLPQNSVNDILQTRDGYLWLATNSGLVRFDGVRFVVFDRSIPGIENQRIGVLHEDRHGTLWAATGDGMLIRYEDGRFTTYTIGTDGLPLGIGVRIEEDAEGALWVTWYDGDTTIDITRFDGQRFVTVGAEHFSHGVAPPPGNRYLDLWWSQDSSGVHVLEKGRVRTYSLRGGLAAVDATGVNADSRGNVWIRTDGAGVIRAAHGRLERYTTREGLPSNHPDGRFFADGKGNLWFQDLRTNKAYRIRAGKHEVIDLGLRAVYVDREGSTWLGTTTAGLHRLRDRTISIYTERDGLSVNNVYSILEDRTGVVWVGTGGEGSLNRYAHGRFTSYNSAGDLPSDRITCLYEDRSGRLWIGSQNAGLTYVQNAQFKRYNDPSGFLTGSVWDIIEDRAGTFWFATDTGLVMSDGDRLARYTSEDGLPDDRITALFEERSGALWIGTQQGLASLKDGAFTAYTQDQSFIGNQVRALHEDTDGILWIGTYDGGLYRFADGQLTRYTRNEGLHDNGVFQILEDDDGHLWMGSNRGIQRLSRRELNEFAEGQRRSVTAVVFDAKDGLATAEVNGGPQPSGLKRADGTLWFPTMGGVAVVDPTVLRVTTPPPAAIIEEVRVGGETVAFSDGISIPSRIATLDLRYTAPGFIKPEQVRFRYRLVGVDDDWIDAETRRVVSFHRIPPGKYRFVVTASSPYGIWSSESESLEIVVLPPFWRTWWFMGFSAIALVAVALAAHERRVRRVREEHARQLAFSRQVIDSQERERRRLSNEMHDSLGADLTLIKKRAERAREVTLDQQRVDAELAEIGMLAEQISVAMKEIARGLRPYHLDKIGLSKTIEKMVQKIGGACHLEVVADIAPMDDLFPGDSQIHVYRIVQECLNNVVKHACAGHVKVTAARDARSVRITVEDDGQGFDPESLDVSGPSRHGFGLMGVRERARILGGTVEIRSAIGGATAVIVTFLLEGGGHG